MYHSPVGCPQLSSGVSPVDTLPRLWLVCTLAGTCAYEECSPFAQLLQSTTSAQAQVVPQKFQLLPAPADEVHAFHMLIQRGVHQLQVDEGLGPDLGQELQGLPAYLRKSMKILPVQPRLLFLAGCCDS